MKYLILSLAVFLSGCSLTLPIARKFPEAPKELLEKCPPLRTVEDPVLLSELTKSVTKNYTTYHECSAQVNGWIEWYSKQKSNFESAK